jgi:RNA polymerase sigma factor (sigma-70 family)
MEVNSLTPKLMKTISDRDLMEGLHSPRDQEEVVLLQTEFFNRYRGFVFMAASQRTRNYLDGDEMAKDISQETFINALKKRKKPFQFPKNTPDDECQYVIKAWLGRIVNNEFNRQLALKKEEAMDDEYEETIAGPADDPSVVLDGQDDEQPEITNEFALKLQEAMNAIKNDRDRHILEEYAREGCLLNGKHLSPAKLEWLCKLYQTTPDNVRQIKTRTFSKVKTICFKE